MTTNRTFWRCVTMMLLFATLFRNTIAQAQNVPPVSLPVHDLLDDQDANLANGVVQTTVLTAGWNWFSTNVETTLADLQRTPTIKMAGGEETWTLTLSRCTRFMSVQHVKSRSKECPSTRPNTPLPSTTVPTGLDSRSVGA